MKNPFPDAKTEHVFWVPLCVALNNDGCETPSERRYCMSRKQPMCGGFTDIDVLKLTNSQIDQLCQIGVLP